jgi:hypothetical protein
VRSLCSTLRTASAVQSAVRLISWERAPSPVAPELPVHCDPRAALTSLRLTIAKASGLKPGGGGKLQAYGFGGKYTGRGSAPPPLEVGGKGTFGSDEKAALKASQKVELGMARTAALTGSDETEAKAHVVNSAAASIYAASKGDPALAQQLRNQVGETLVGSLDTLVEFGEHKTVEGSKLNLGPPLDATSEEMDQWQQELEEISPYAYQRFRQGIFTASEAEAWKRFPGDSKADESAREYLLGNLDAARRRLQFAEDQIAGVAMDLHMTPDELLARYRTVGLEGIGAQRAAQNYVNQWADTSMDGHTLSLAIQISAARAFGISEDSLGWVKDRVGSTFKQQSIQDYLDNEGLIMQEFHRSVYRSTQTLLDAQGITEMALVRGLDADLKSGLYRMSPLNSFSTEAGTAMTFGQYTTMVTVPKERIYSTWMTGQGCKDEREFVVLGSDQPDEFTVFNSMEVVPVYGGREKETATPGWRSRVGEGLVGEMPTKRTTTKPKPQGVILGEPGSYYAIKPQKVPAGYKAVQSTGGKKKGQWGVKQIAGSSPSHLAGAGVYTQKPLHLKPGLHLVPTASGKWEVF